MQNLASTLDLLTQNLLINKIPKLFLYTLKFKNTVFRFLGKWGQMSEHELYTSFSVGGKSSHISYSDWNLVNFKKI